MEALSSSAHPKKGFEFRKPQADIDPKAIKETPQESISRSRDMALYIYLRNMTGGEQDLGTAIRELAENAAADHKPMDILETGEGVAFKTLYFQEGMIRNRGDFMVYGEKTKRHESPRVISTIISSRDYVKQILTDEIELDSDTQYDLIGDHLNGMMGYPAKFRRGDEAAKHQIETKYEQKKRDGDITLYLNENPVKALEQAYKDGKRFDLALPDLMETTDRMNMLQAIQATLKDGGYAFIPITWWRAVVKMVPRSEIRWDADDRRLGLDKGDDLVMKDSTEDAVLIDDVVNVDGKSVPFEDYLAKTFPDVFQIAHFTHAKTLVVRGTKTPIELPEFSAKVRTNSKSTEGSTSIEWTLVK